MFAFFVVLHDIRTWICVVGKIVVLGEVYSIVCVCMKVDTMQK